MFMLFYQNVFLFKVDACSGGRIRRGLKRVASSTGRIPMGGFLSGASPDSASLKELQGEAVASPLEVP